MATAPLPDLFRSLADPTRLRLLAALRQGELSVGELAEALSLVQSGISRHLSVLKASGLVRDRREGTSSFYSVPQEPSDERARALWPTLNAWLADVPGAASDAIRVARVLQARRRSDYFQDVAPHWDSIRAAQYGEELRHQALLELIPRDLRVLDVGTGTGFMLLGIAPRVDRVTGVDASEAMLEKARENLAAAGIDNADLSVGHMEELPIAAGSVDVVLANMALHHAPDPARALREMARVLAPGGRVVLTDLARHAHDWTRVELADEWPGFLPEELIQWMKAARLEDPRVRAIGTCTLARSSAHDRHAADVLLATARAPSKKRAAPSRSRIPTHRTESRATIRNRG